MATGITTSIVVQFSKADAEASAILQAEIDDRDDGLNSGNTSFEPSQTAYFLVYKSDNVTYDTPRSTAGSIVSAASGVREVEDEFITFTGDNTGSTQYPIRGKSLSSYKWVGLVGGVVSVTGENEITVTPLTEGADVFGVLAVSYSADYQAYGIKSPATLAGYTEFPIVAYIIGEIEGT